MQNSDSSDVPVGLRGLTGTSFSAADLQEVVDEVEDEPEETNVEVDRTKHPSGIVPTLQYAPCVNQRLFILSECWHVKRNIVSTVNLGTRLDLKFIALHARNAEYNPKVAFFFH